MICLWGHYKHYLFECRNSNLKHLRLVSPVVHQLSDLVYVHYSLLSLLYAVIILMLMCLVCYIKTTSFGNLSA